MFASHILSSTALSAIRSSAAAQTRTAERTRKEEIERERLISCLEKSERERDRERQREEKRGGEKKNGKVEEKERGGKKGAKKQKTITQSGVGLATPVIATGVGRSPLIASLPYYELGASIGPRSLATWSHWPRV